jgi:hypothetical protein
MAVLRGVIFFPFLFWLREARCVLQQQDVVGDFAIYVDQHQDRSLGASLPYWELAGNRLTPLRASIIVET